MVTCVPKSSVLCRIVLVNSTAVGHEHHTPHQVIRAAPPALAMVMSMMLKVKTVHER